MTKLLLSLAVVLAAAGLGAGDDAETDTPEIPSALASKGAASARASAAAMSANAAAEICPMFLFMSPTTVNSRNNSSIRLFSSVTRSSRHSFANVDNAP